MSLPSFAQAQALSAPTETEDQTSSEIVVTASKSANQKVLDAPLSIQAIGGDSLQKTNTAGFLELSGRIPGLSVETLGPGNSKYIIRGINSRGEATTGVYYDEAVISGANSNDGSGLQADIRLYDLDHVEVLRGPQGTLYGAGSMSGTIRFVTKKPKLDKFEGFVGGEISSTSQGEMNYGANGMVNLPIAEGKVALRAVGWFLNDGGYVDAIRLGTLPRQKNLNNDYVRGGRLALRVQPTDSLTIDASFTAQSEQSDGSSRYTPAGVTAFSGPTVPPVLGCDLCNTDVARSPYSENLQVYSLVASYDAGFGVFTATTNQFNRKLELNLDSTPVLLSFDVPIPAETYEPQQRNVNSSEIRFASKFDGDINFVIGAYRQQESSDLTVHVIRTNGLGLANGPFSPLDSDDALSANGNTFLGREDHRWSTQYAIFGEATWQVTPRLQVIGGARYFSQTLNGYQITTHPFGGFGASQPVGRIINPTSTFHKPTFKANVSYKLSPETLFYATASEGFRGGGLNAQSLPIRPVPGTFAPDKLWSYEAGVKGRLLGGLLNYQLDVFLIDWSNIQAPLTTAEAFNYTGNAGDARIKGVEFEFTARPFAHLTASLSGSYQDAKLIRGATPLQKSLNPTLGLSGERIPQVARLQFNANLDYSAPLNDTWDLELGADFSYRGKMDSYYRSNAFNIPLEAYGLLNLRAGVSTGGWTASAFVHNATNKRAQVSAINDTINPLALLTVRPRTIGLNVLKKF